MIRESDTRCDSCKAKLCDEAIEVGRKFCFECGGEDDCPVCHGQGATTDHHDPCTECAGRGKVGGEE